MWNVHASEIRGYHFGHCTPLWTNDSADLLGFHLPTCHTQRCEAIIVGIVDHQFDRNTRQERWILIDHFLLDTDGMRPRPAQQDANPQDLRGDRERRNQCPHSEGSNRPHCRRHKQRDGVVRRRVLREPLYRHSWAVPLCLDVIHVWKPCPHEGTIIAHVRSSQ